MEYSLEDIPIEIEGFHLPASFPSTSRLSDSEPESYNSDNDSAESDEEKQRKYVIKTSKLSAHLKGLMGEANLRYARGDFETAKKMCFEVIRQVPDAFEPYITLAHIYENSNSRKYKAFLMLASHLRPDASILCRLSEINEQENCLSEAIECMSKAITASPKDVSLHQRRIALLEKKGDQKAILRCKYILAKKMSRKQHQALLDLCMEVAKEYFKQKNFSKAIEALRTPLEKIPSKISKDLLNMMLELLLLSERYSECLDIFTQFCGFTFDVMVTEENVFVVNSYTLPENIQTDLKVKFIVCLIRLQGYNLISDLINKILIEDDVETFGDLYLDIVEALMALQHYQEALKLLVPLVKSNNYSMAGVWLKHAECLSACGLYDQAIEAYFTVMSMAPKHVEVLYPLAMLLLNQNKKKEALEVLSLDLSQNKIDVAVLLEQLKLLKQIDDMENYWKSCELLLSRHCIVLKNIEELKTVTTMQTFNEKKSKIQKMRNFRGQCNEVESGFESIREPTIEEEYKIYRDILQLALDKKEYGLLQKFAYMGLCSRRFTKYFDEIYLAAYYSCVLNKDNFHGYSTIREIILRQPAHNLAWNWFTLITQTSPEDVRHSRFLDRFDEKFTENKKVVLANYHASVGNYTESLSFFMKEFKRHQSSYCTFMLGVIMSQIYCQRQVDKNLKKIIAETVTYLFLNYAKMRTKSAKHETYYNLGRMYHQLGVMYLAEYYYSKVLKVHNDLLDKYPEILGLKREAAYNLHVIYKNNGNYVAARNIIMEHIVI